MARLWFDRLRGGDEANVTIDGTNLGRGQVAVVRTQPQREVEVRGDERGDHEPRRVVVRGVGALPRGGDPLLHGRVGRLVARAAAWRDDRDPQLWKRQSDSSHAPRHS